MKINKKLSWVLLSAMALFAAACDKTDEAGGNGNGQGNGETVTYKFGLDVEQVKTVSDDNSVRTLSAGDINFDAAGGSTRTFIDDETISTVTVLQFEGTTGTSKLLKKEQCIATDGVLQIELDKTNTATNNRIYFVAGVGVSQFASLTVNSSTINDLLGLTIELSSKSAVMGDGLPMIGHNDLLPVSSVDPTDPESRVGLYRVVAGINLIMDKGSLPTGWNFVISSVQVKNVAKRVNVSEPAVGAIYPAAGAANFYDYAVESDAAAKSMNQTFYVPENLRGTNSAITTVKDKGLINAPAHSTYIEIVGKYGRTGSEDIDVIYHVFPGGNNTTDFNIKRNTMYEINLLIAGIASAEDARVIVGENLSVDASGNPATANSYVVLRPNARYRIDATVMGNGATTAPTTATDVYAPGITPTRLVPTSAEVIWQSESGVIESVKYTKAGYLEFATGSVAEGNAVIGVKDASSGTGEVAWSWHIWKTASDPRASTDDMKARHPSTAALQTIRRIMQRNLGSANNNVDDVSAFGLLYQWGRKDPFPGAAAYAANSDAKITRFDNNYAWKDGTNGTSAVAYGTVGADAVAYAVKHPTHFITGDATTNDWVTNVRGGQRDDLWGNANTLFAPSGSLFPFSTALGSKSIYDPCPIGWKVAPQDTWTAFTKHVGGADIGGRNTTTVARFNTVSSAPAKGMTFYIAAEGSGSTTHIPATGYRNGATGALTGVENNAGIWASTNFGKLTYSPLPNTVTYSTSAFTYDMTTPQVAPLAGVNRADAYSVRCIQE